MNAIEVEHISKVYGSRRVLDDISFIVKQESIHGFLGPNGAGKTTTMRIITELAKSSSGTVDIFSNGQKIHKTKLYQHIGFLLEEPPLYKDMTVLEYIRFVAKLRKIPQADIQHCIDYAIDALDLSAVVNRSIENLSKGYKQRVGIAQAIVHRPKILILDEPTVGLDPHSVKEMRNLILNLKKEHTILISSHLLHEMSLICDDITIISSGTILKTGSMASLKKDLANKQEIHLVFKKVNETFYTELKQLELFDSINISDCDEGVLVVLKPKDTGDYRNLLIKKSVELDVELLEISKKEFSLEDLFLEVTESHD